jgi:hypothetical protein
MQEATRRAAWHSLARCFAVVTGLLVAYALLPLRGDWWWVGAAVGALALGALVPVTVRRLRAVAASERPVIAAVEALVLLLAMLVTGFAAVYYGMDRNGDQFAGLTSRVDSIYFTVTTLATVGFGDIVATGTGARVVVTVQMVFDLVFVGLAVRVLSSVARLRAGDRAVVGRDA